MKTGKTELRTLIGEKQEIHHEYLKPQRNFIKDCVVFTWKHPNILGYIKRIL